MKLRNFFLLYIMMLTASGWGADSQLIQHSPETPSSLKTSQEVKGCVLANGESLEVNKSVPLDINLEPFIAEHPEGKIVFSLKDLSQDQLDALMRVTRNSNIQPSFLDKFYRDPQSKRVRVLSLDGGGTRGIMEALVLQKLEELTGKRVYDLFDVFAGTSTAAFIILAACSPKPSNELSEEDKFCSDKFYSMSDVVEFYRKESPIIFSNYSNWSMGGLAGTQYKDKPLLDIIEKYFKKDATLAEIVSTEKLVIITGYDLDKHTPVLFSSDKALQNKECPISNPSVSDLVRAAVSAPTYFDPITLSSLDKEESMRCADGGISNNNPILVAIFCACLKFKCSFNDLGSVLSLGAGYTLPSSDETYLNYGVRQWAPHLLKMLFNGQSQQFLADIFFEVLGKEEDFKRVQYIIPDSIYDLAKCSPDHFDALTEVAQTYMEEHPETFTELAKQLGMN